MAITDEHGNKLPQPRMSKLALSAKFRDIASKQPQYGISIVQQREMVTAGSAIGQICMECGYHIRSKNHDAGAHHKGIVAPCRR